MITATRYHDLSCGHRVHGHESKCAYLHGHNYRVIFTCVAEALDSVGRVIDFSMINTLLCQWLEQHYDHRFLAWIEDPFIGALVDSGAASHLLADSIVWTPFNPTAENIAHYLLTVIGPQQLEGTGVTLIKVVVEETRKCSASASL